MEATSERQLKDKKQRGANRQSAKESGVLSVAQILGADDVEYLLVPVEEWGGSVRFKQLTAAENVEFQSLIDSERKSNPNKRRGIDLLLLRKTMVDEAGNKLIDRTEDFENFRKKSGRIIRRLAIKALEFNGLNDPARDARMGAKRLRAAADGEREDIAERLNEIADEMLREVEDDDLVNS